MPPVNLKRLQARDSGISGRGFSIVFGVIASAVIIACLVWGVLWPKYRKKYPPNPSPTRYNIVRRTDVLVTPSSSNSPPVFPSHPAIRRDFHKQPSRTSLRTYNPRTETPFPNPPIAGENISLSSLKPRKTRVENNNIEDGSGELFTPARDRLPSRRGRINDPNSIIATNENIHPTSIDGSLAIPEPLLLRARLAGKAPPLRARLAKFPLPRSGSSSAGDLTHPKKLFQEVETRYSKNLPAAVIPPSRVSSNTNLEAIVQSLPKPSPVARGYGTESNPEISPVFPNTQATENERAVTTSAEDRAARPMTPVEACATRVQAEGELSTGARLSSKNGTVSSVEPFSESTISTQLLSTTPPTSPLYVPEVNRAVKSASVTDTGQISSNNTLPTGFACHNRRRHSSLIHPSTAQDLTAIAEIHTNKPEVPQHHVSKTKTFSKARPARLNLEPLSESPSLSKKLHRLSVSSVGSMLAPLVKPKHPSMQASSIYSRDTRGVSYMQSPVSPWFSDQDGSAGGKHETQQDLSARKASSLELLKCKIDDWNLDIDGLDFPLTPNSNLRRALSDAHVRSPTFPNLDTPGLFSTKREEGEQKSLASIPAICVARPSDDIFRDPIPDVERGRVLRRVLDMEVAESTSHSGRTRGRGTAPGGADWI